MLCATSINNRRLELSSSNADCDKRPRVLFWRSSVTSALACGGVLNGISEVTSQIPSFCSLQNGYSGMVCLPQWTELDEKVREFPFKLSEAHLVR